MNITTLFYSKMCIYPHSRGDHFIFVYYNSVIVLSNNVSNFRKFWERLTLFQGLLLPFIKDSCITFWSDEHCFGSIGFRSLVEIFEKFDFQRLQSCGE